MASMGGGGVSNGPGTAGHIDIPAWMKYNGTPAKAAPVAPPPAVGGAPMAGPAASAASAIAPMTPGPIAPTAPGAAKIVEPDSMVGLKAAGADMSGGGGPMDNISTGEPLNGPSQFRQGVGTRTPPQLTNSLAALRKVY